MWDVVIENKIMFIMTLIIGSYMVTWLPIDMLFVWLCIYKTIESTAMGLMALSYIQRKS